MTGPPRRAPHPQAAPLRDLAQRTGSALVLAAAAGLAAYAGLWPFAVLVAAAGAVLAWEWGRLVRGAMPDTAFYAHALGAGAAAVLVAAGQSAAALGALGAGAGAAALMAGGRTNRLWSAAGVLYPGLAVFALVSFRSDPVYGLAAILFLFAVVWSADTAAYFTGRMLGGAKLAPAISPGKTWSGFAGGLAVPTLLSFGFGLWLGGTHAPSLALTGAGLALASQIGDLAESAIKRTFHVKDTGQLLPGHGGLFDRVDGLIGASIAAGCIAMARDLSNPGKALLIWP